MFSGWLVIGLVLGAIAGTLATDLTLVELRERRTLNWTPLVWEWPRKQLLFVVVGLLIGVIVALSIAALHWPGMSGSWADLLLGTAIGGAAAPWLWLHFVRNFGSNATKEYTELEALIGARAHQIWLQEGCPEGRAAEHYAKAKDEIQKSEERAIEDSAKVAEQQLARYRLVSILLGVVLLVAMLRPALKDWLPRTQQFQAFGVSLLIAQRSDQTRGTPVLGFNSPSEYQGTTDRLSSATADAYQIGAPKRVETNQQVATMGLIGPDLNRFEELSMIDRDRSFIAWLVYERPQQFATSRNWTAGTRTARDLEISDLSLLDYVQDAERRVREHNPAKQLDTIVDLAFVSDSSMLSRCLQGYADAAHDPHLFTVLVGAFLRSYVHSVHQIGEPADPGSTFAVPEFPNLSSLMPDYVPGCEATLLQRLFSWATWPQSGYPDSSTADIEQRFEVTPYPSLVAADYLAAIGAVDTGVQFIQEWVDRFRRRHPKLAPDFDPQLGWYQVRAMLNAAGLPYQFGGLSVPHRQLVNWQTEESDQFGRLLHVGDADSWKRLCSRVRPSTLHNNIGQWIAFNYATDRFYLYENLTAEDFDPPDPIAPQSLSAYLHEAEAIRDNLICFDRVPSYRSKRPQYASYFVLYTAQLRLAQLARERNASRRSDLIETIGHELDQADHFGKAPDTLTLLAASDIWEKHRGRLTLLRAQLEDEKKR